MTNPRANGDTSYAELVAATNYSFLRGASHPHEIVQQAAAHNLAAIGIADRNSLAGVVRAYEAARDAGIKLIVGARLVTTDGFEVVCHPADRAAYGRLCRLLTEGNRRAPKGECHLSFEEILAAQEGQIFIALPPRVLTPAFSARLAALAAAAPGRAYLGASFAYRGDERRRLGELNELAAEAGALLVATNDVIYHEPAQRPLADVLACIREKCTIAEAGFRLEANAERHVKDGAEMARLFARYPEAIARTREIADRVHFSLEALRYEYPDEPSPPGKSPQQHLEDLTWTQAAGRYPEGVPQKVRELLRKELVIIAACDYARYFLTVYDIVRFARSQHILCQGRGSAANSAVCYCLGITAVDPATIDLLFERFVSAERREPPDIDVDFEHERREEVIQYLYDRYGRHRAAICATVIHYRPRMAVREVGKALGLKEDVTAALAGTVWGYGGAAIPDKHILEAGLDPANSELRQAIALTNMLIGFPRHLSQHVGGFVLTRERLDETVPVLNAAMEDRTNIEWDKDDIDTLGMLKVDVLGLGMLTCIRKSFEFIKQHYDRALTLATVPPEDPAVYEMLSKADSVGVFQVESRAQMSMLPRLKPRNFYDLVIEVAIVRPGPIQGDMVHPYLRRREGKEPVTYPSPALQAVLGKTLGVPLFQEQAMQIAIVGAGFPPAKADKLRRAMATFRHTGTIHHFRADFIEGMIANDYSRDFAERCFSQIEGFGEYGFPESHAASFALLVYVSAWIKRFHPEVFCAALLNSQPMGFYQPAQLVRDARDHGIEVRPPDVNFSDWDCTLEPPQCVPLSRETGEGQGEGPSQSLDLSADGTTLTPTLSRTRERGTQPSCALRLGLRQIDGLAEAQARAIVAARRTGYADIPSLWIKSGVPASMLERLAAADAFRSLGLDRRAALWAVKGLDGGLGGGARDGKATRALPSRRPILRQPECGDLFAEPPVALPAMTLGEHVAEDYATMGLSLKAHPCAFFRDRLKARGVITSLEHRDIRRKDQRVAVAGLVLVRQHPGSTNVTFLTLEDETGIVNIVVWPKIFEANRRTLMSSRFLLVRGPIQREGLVIHVVAESFVDLTDELRLLNNGEALPSPAVAVETAPALPRLFKSRDFH
jgi:error-prone DNA polymerase